MTNSNSKAFDIDERLIAFPREIVLYSGSIKKDFTSEYYTKQMIRSSGSAALNFGELQGTITTKDFIFKASLFSILNLPMLSHPEPKNY